MSPADNDELPVYALRVAGNAYRQADDEWLRLAQIGGAAFADVWREGFRTALASLATFPNRCPLALENDLYGAAHPGETLRQVLRAHKTTHLT